MKLEGKWKSRENGAISHGKNQTGTPGKNKRVECGHTQGKTEKTEVGRRVGLVVACASAPNLSKQCNRAAGRVFRS